MMKLPRHKCGLYLTHNEHRDDYQTALQGIEKYELICDHELDWATPDARERCIATNELWQLQWYPDTPIGSYSVFGATLEEVLKAAREIQEQADVETRTTAPTR